MKKSSSTDGDQWTAILNLELRKLYVLESYR